MAQKPDSDMNRGGLGSQQHTQDNASRGVQGEDKTFARAGDHHAQGGRKGGPATGGQGSTTFEQGADQRGAAQDHSMNHTADQDGSGGGMGQGGMGMQPGMGEGGTMGGSGSMTARTGEGSRMLGEEEQGEDGADRQPGDDGDLAGR